MIYLGIDFGTVWTKATLFDSGSKKFIYVPLEDRPDIDYVLSGTVYTMPTAVFYDTSKGTYSVGQAAINKKNLDRCNFFDNFKPQLSGNEVWASKTVKYRDLVVAILKHVKDKAVASYNGTIDKCVITIPASTIEYDNRWELMQEAAILAGFSDVEFIKEPEAAGYYLLSQDFEKNVSNIEGNIYLIYDFGGGTFDCSLIKIKDRQIWTLCESIGSDEHQKWGGIYIDNIIRQDFIRNCSKVSNAVAKMRAEGSMMSQETIKLLEILRNEPIKVKHTLSKETQYHGSHGYTINIDKYEGMIDGMIDETIECCLNLIREANQIDETIKLDNISAIFLVGGSSMIQLIRKKWEQKRTDKTQFEVILKDSDKSGIGINPIINAVASGAAEYPYLRPSAERLIEFGLNKIEENDYVTAALYFYNTRNEDGKYWLGVLYYVGVLGKKPQYRKAYNLFEESSIDKARFMMALMKFKGEGTKKNDSSALTLLKSTPRNDIRDVLKRILEGNYSQDDLNRIYEYNPISEIKKNFQEYKSQNGSKSYAEISPKDLKKGFVAGAWILGAIFLSAYDRN